MVNRSLSIYFLNYTLSIPCLESIRSFSTFLQRQPKHSFLRSLVSHAPFLFYILCTNSITQGYDGQPYPEHLFIPLPVLHASHICSLFRSEPTQNTFPYFSIALLPRTTSTAQRSSPITNRDNDSKSLLPIFIRSSNSFHRLFTNARSALVLCFTYRFSVS